jgi:hypothetical protein
MEQREGVFANQDMLEDQRFACSKRFVDRYLALPDSRRLLVAGWPGKSQKCSVCGWCATIPISCFAYSVNESES